MRITLDDETFRIPYGREEYEGGVIHPYRSLVEHPEQIDQIPEVVGQPALRELLKVLNGSEGRFESVRIDSTYHAFEGAMVHVAVIGFIFRDRQLFSHFDSCLLFAGNLLEALHAEDAFPEGEDAAQLELQRATFGESRQQGWIMDLFLLGQGTDRKACDAELALRCNALQQLFREKYALR
ncbi:hypothetical protein R5M92_07370 [Halomonas sp. Bachu 37]|uniref:hypothetical protein n=1 Tax=Halomonas kashgarensis TaxID=3084920 RepID=UPI00321788E8